MIAVGICSTAHPHHGAYAPILQGMDGVEFLGIADEDEERGRSAAEEIGCDYRNTDELLDAADGVVVCSANAAHREWIERAGDRGTHVLSEKPLAPTVDEARTAVEAAEDAGIRLGLAMPLRFSEPIRRAERALTSGELGDLYAISGTNRGEMPGGWFTDPEASGGGAITDHTVHIVDVVRDLTGREVAEVYAESGTRFHDIEVEDVNVLSMELEDGTQFLLDGSWSRPEEWPTWGGATLELQGRAGTMAVDCFGQTLEYVGSQGETDTETVFWGRDPNAGLLEDFVASLREDRDPEIPGEEGVRAVAVIEAAYESVERGEPVAVE